MFSFTAVTDIVDGVIVPSFAFIKTCPDDCNETVFALIPSVPSEIIYQVSLIVFFCWVPGSVNTAVTFISLDA